MNTGDEITVSGLDWAENGHEQERLPTHREASELIKAMRRIQRLSPSTPLPLWKQSYVADGGSQGEWRNSPPLWTDLLVMPEETRNTPPLLLRQAKGEGMSLSERC